MEVRLRLENLFLCVNFKASYLKSTQNSCDVTSCLCCLLSFWKCLSAPVALKTSNLFVSILLQLFLLSDQEEVPLTCVLMYIYILHLLLFNVFILFIVAVDICAGMVQV